MTTENKLPALLLRSITEIVAMTLYLVLLSYLFLLFIHFLGECWNWDLLAKRKEGQRWERSGSVSSVWDPDHQQGHQQSNHLRPWGQRGRRGIGKKKKKIQTCLNGTHSHLLHCLHWLCPQVFPLVAGEDEDDVKSIRSHRIKMEISGHSLEESMEECRVEEMSVHKVRGNIWCQDYHFSRLNTNLTTSIYFCFYQYLSL